MIWRLSALNRHCSFLKARLLSEGVDYPRTHSVRVLLEILSDLAPESEKSKLRGILESVD